jgi:hypothetical protein
METEGPLCVVEFGSHAPPERVERPTDPADALIGTTAQCRGQRLTAIVSAVPLHFLSYASTSDLPVSVN